MPTSPQRAALRRERMALAVELHTRGLRQQAIGDELGVSQVSAGRLLRAAGVVTHEPGQPPKHPIAQPRACEHCGASFTPYPSRAARTGGGRFCSAACRVAGLRKHDPVSERACANPKCGRAFTPHPGNVHKGRGIYCSEECRRTGDTITCKHCGAEVYLPKSHLSRSAGFCSRRCAGAYRWKHVLGLGPLLSSMHATGQLRGRRAQQLLGHLGSRKPPAPGGRKRGRPAVTATPAQTLEIRKLSDAGWGRRAIATRLRMSERAVRNVLDAAA